MSVLAPAVLLLAVAIAGCAAGGTMTPAQQRVHDAFEQCKIEAGAPTARLDEVMADGRFRVSAGRDAAADLGMIKKCLWERHQLRAIGG